MKHPIELDPDKYFTDPDMPFFGLRKTESNVAAVKQLWEDSHPITIGDVGNIIYGTPGSSSDGEHLALMNMFHDEGFFL